MKDRIKINISKDANNIKSANFYNSIGIYVLNQQLKSGVIPSNDDGSFDPWDFIESITALNFIFRTMIMTMIVIRIMMIKVIKIERLFTIHYLVMFNKMNKEMVLVIM